MRMITPERVLQSIQGVFDGESGVRQELVHLAPSAALRA